MLSDLEAHRYFEIGVQAALGALVAVITVALLILVFVLVARAAWLLTKGMFFGVILCVSSLVLLIFDLVGLKYESHTKAAEEHCAKHVTVSEKFHFAKGEEPFNVIRWRFKDYFLTKSISHGEDFITGNYNAEFLYKSADGKVLVSKYVCTREDARSGRRVFRCVSELQPLDFMP